MQRPSWSGFQFPIELPLESVGGRLNQTSESAMLFDVGLTVVPGLTFPAEFPFEFVASSATLSVTVDVLDKIDTDPLLVDVGIQKSELANVLLDVGVSQFELVPLIIDIVVPTDSGIAILDRQRQIRAILPGCRWHYRRRLNEATELSVYIPRQVVTDNIPAGHDLEGFFSEGKAKYAEIAAFVQVFAGGRLKASGKINRRTLGELVTIQAYTEEILLEANLTPAQYGKVWDGWDLADVARDLLDGWQSIRVKDQSQWQARMVDSSNVDLTTDPGLVMLAKRASGQYYDSGYITLVFNKSEIPRFKSWDRVRWSADSEDPVKTSIQISTDGTNFSAPFDGGLPEEVGYYIGGDHDRVWVRINLSTSDTESEDENGNKVGVTPTVFALEVIARTEGDLVAGNIPDAAGVTVKGIEADHASAFQVLLAACEQVGWEFQVVNGALNIAENLGVDRTKDFVLRAGTNMEITSLGDDDEELVNILTAYGPGSGINRMEITLRDEDSIAQFGPYPKAMEFEAETLAELEQKAQEYLDSHNTPTVAFEVAAVFDFEHEPEYGLGDVVRVVDPDTGIVTTARIMDESREFSENGLSVHLGLGKAALNLQSVLEGKERPTKPLDPLTPTGVYARGIIKGIVVGCSAPKTDWAYTECHVSTAKGFVPGSATLVDKGKQTRFDIPNLDPGVRYYARLIHVDSSGRRSEPSREVSAVAQYVPVEALPDYSIGIEKFMENIKPPIMVSSLPKLPDPRYTVGTTVYLITDKKLYSTDGNTWTPVGAGTVTADEIMAGIISAGGITADHMAANTLHVFDKVPGTAAGGKVTINSSGVTITDGKLIVKNPAGITIIDGTSNMLKVHQTGVAYPNEEGTVVISFPDLGYKPAFLFYLVNPDGDTIFPYYFADTAVVSTNPPIIRAYHYGAVGIISRTSLTLQSAWRNTPFRYYIFKEEAI